MVPTGNGDRWRHALILIVTRRCNLRCAYCPTVKDGLPDLTRADVRRAIDLFVDRYGGGDVKLFGGEPLLVPHLVEEAIRYAPDTCNIYLSTNAVPFDASIHSLLCQYPRTTLTVSIDGTEADHDGLRRGDTSHAKVMSHLPDLLRLPRFVVTQTIAPSTAIRAAENFRYLRGRGIRRFNLLPGYYLPWKEHQIEALCAGFTTIGDDVEAAWAEGEKLYLRNLFVRAPTAFFNTGFVVDVDRSIHPTNLVLAAKFGDLPGIGTLDDPPTVADLDRAARDTSDTLAARLAPGILEATHAVDAELTRLVNRLYPAYFRYRQVAA